MSFPRVLVVCLATAVCARAAVEEPIDHRFVAAKADPVVGDWEGAPGCVAQVTATKDSDYEAVLWRAFEVPKEQPLATLRGAPARLEGNGWSGSIADGRFTLVNGDRRIELRHVVRPSPTLGAQPPTGAVVLFDGRSLDAWANKKGKEWLVEDGPAPWKIVDGVLEVVPGTGGGIITHRKFGDCHVHLEFRTLGAPSNSGVFFETRYEVNINESYGSTGGTPNGGLDNCTPKGTEPRVRAARPPLAWQTFDIDFTAPRFDADGHKVADATATVFLNGAMVYERQALERPHGAAGRLGEAPTGPLMLQEHGMPLQFRNIWVVERQSR